MDKDVTDAAEFSLPIQRFGELLRQLSSQGVSQAQVAKRTGTSSQYVSDVRHDQRPLTELFARRLGEEFGFNYLWLLGEENSHERPGFTVPPSGSETKLLPLMSKAIAGDPRDHPRWKGAYHELTGIAAAKAARALHPYVLDLDHGDRKGRLRKGDLVLISQASSEKTELSVVSCGKKVVLARKIRGKWIGISSGEPLRGDCAVVGHCLGVVWSAMI